MAVLMGRSCSSYGVHLRAYLPPAACPSISSHLLGSITRLNVSFFRCSAVPSCHSRMLELYVFLSSSSFCLHSEAEQTGTGTSSRQVPSKKGVTSLPKGFDTGEEGRVPSIDLERSGVGSSRSTSRLRQLPAKQRAPSLEKEVDTGRLERPFLTETEQSGSSSTRSASRLRSAPAKKRAPSSAKKLGAGEGVCVSLADAEQSIGSAPPLRQPRTKKQHACSGKGLDAGNREQDVSVKEEQSGGTSPCPESCVLALPTKKPRKKRASSLQKRSDTGDQKRFSSAEAEQLGGFSACSTSPLQQLPTNRQGSSLEREFHNGKLEQIYIVEEEQSGSAFTPSSAADVLQHLSTKKRASSLKKEVDSGEEARLSLVVAEQSGPSCSDSASSRGRLPAKVQSSSLEKELDKGNQGRVSLVEADQAIGNNTTSSAFLLQQFPTENRASPLAKDFDTGFRLPNSSVEAEQIDVPSINSGPRVQQLPAKELDSSFKKVLDTSEKVYTHFESRLQQMSAKRQASLVEAEEAGGNTVCSVSCLQELPAENRVVPLEREVKVDGKVHCSQVENVSNVHISPVTNRTGMAHDIFSRQQEIKEERISFSSVIPIQNEPVESVEPIKSITHSGAKHAVQGRETNYRQQWVARTERPESQQQHILANFDKAYGWERKKKKECLVRNVIANQASTISYVQILGTGFDTGETVPTVLLFFDRRRFLFNVGEGLHRFCMEHKLKLSKIDHVFLTRVCSETVGGLPGLVLTLAQMNESGYTVRTWGPSSLDDLAQAMSKFVPSGWMEHTTTFGSGENDNPLLTSCFLSSIFLLEDELIKISAVLLSPENAADSSSKLQKKNGNMLATVYVCELSTVRGKFDPDRARAKGLRPGNKYRKLQNGESVLSDDGTTMVHPADVLGPSSPGPILFVVDCPSTSYISSLTSSTSLQSFFSETGKVVNCMIHIGPTSVTRSGAYQSWMENFKETHHIMARPEVKVLGMPTLAWSATTLSKLNLVCPWIFPITEIDAKEDKVKEPANGHIVSGANLLKYCLRPLSELGPDSSEVPEVFDYTSAQEKWDEVCPEVFKARDMALEVWKRWSEENSSSASGKGRANRNSETLPACLEGVSREEMELIFLGTGSAQPSKHRNVTGIYIHLFEKGGVLLDCGEGTLAQLKRRYGGKGADEVLLGLKCIWISHLHADHFAGILRILSARRDLLHAQSSDQRILVIGPRKLKSFLDSYGKIEDLVMEFLDCSQTTIEVQRWFESKSSGESSAEHKVGLIDGSARGASVRSGMQHIWRQPGYHIQHGIDEVGQTRLTRVLNLLGLNALYSVPVIHCPDAFAVVLEAQEQKLSRKNSKPGWKLVFSGDTRPCQAVVEAAHKATILIHEATFEDDLIAEAVKKNHSITQEAINVGVSADVYRIFLTHFSQRYPTIPQVDTRFSDRTCMAFDMMSVNLADLPIVPEFSPALQTLFKEPSDIEEDEAEGVCTSSV